MTYDDLLHKIGDFGTYQKRIYFMLCLTGISCAFHKLGGVFILAKTDHRYIYFIFFFITLRSVSNFIYFFFFQKLPIDLYYVIDVNCRTSRTTLLMPCRPISRTCRIRSITKRIVGPRVKCTM